MKKKTILSGPLHKLPQDLKEILFSESQLKEAWASLTPLAQNEWICWTTSAKKEETRIKRMQRAKQDLLNGKKRPCCWPGCPHRNPNAKKWFKDKRTA